MKSTEKVGKASSNGILLAVQSFACQEFGWSIEYANNASLISLLLLMRQKLSMEGKYGITLEEQEMIMTKDWDTLIKENREKFKNRMG